MASTALPPKLLSAAQVRHAKQASREDNATEVKNNNVFKKFLILFYSPFLSFVLVLRLKQLNPQPQESSDSLKQRLWGELLGRAGILYKD